MTAVALSARKSGVDVAPAQMATPSFDDIYRQYAPFVLRVVRRMGVPDQDVHDVGQEVFLAALRSLDRFEGRSSIRTWLFGIAVRMAAAHRRRARTRATHTPLAAAEMDASVAATQERELELRVAQLTIDRILDGLDEDKRAVFVLFEIEGLTMAEVSEAVGCPVKTAYTRLYAAQKEVRTAVRRLALRGNDGE